MVVSVVLTVSDDIVEIDGDSVMVLVGISVEVLPSVVETVVKVDVIKVLEVVDDVEGVDVVEGVEIGIVPVPVFHNFGSVSLHGGHWYE